VQHPVCVHITTEMYSYLVDAYKDNVISYSCLVKWYDLCFEGIMPDWVYSDGVLARHRLVWRGLRKVISKKPARTSFDIGVCKVVYNSDIRGCEKFRDVDIALRDEIVVSGEQWVSRKLDSILSAEGTLTISSGNRRFLRVLMPNSTTELAMRVKIPPDLALACWHAAGQANKARCSVQTVRRLLRTWGIGGQMFSCLLMTSLVNCDNSHVIDRLVASGVAERGIEYYVGVTKEISEVVRRAGIGMCPMLGLERRVSYHSLMYLQNEAGRFGFNELTSASDIEKRMVEGRYQYVYNGNVWSRSEFDRVAEAGMNDVATAYAQGVAGRANWTAEDLVANLTMIGTAGSAPRKDAPVVTLPDMNKEVMGATKTSWLNEHMNVEYIMSLFTMRPRIRGTGVDKYEAGKQRLLLPGPITHWLIESVALLGGEGRVYRSMPSVTLEVKNMEDLALMLTRLKMPSKGRVGVASDFADHNILHKYRRMIAQWLKMAEAVDPKGAGELGAVWGRGEYMKFVGAACRWAAAALDDVAARSVKKGLLPGGDREGYVRLVRGLWSGWRSTTFINTVFNEYYQRTTQASYNNMYGHKALNDYQILGDDMVGQVDNEWKGLRFLEIIDYSGLDAQAMKQMLSNNRLEYLRLMFEDGASVWGNANRAVSGMVSGDGQTGVVRAGMATARAINESVNTVMRRSGAVDCESWRYTLVRYWATVEVRRPDGTKRQVGPSQALLEASSAHGGMGCGRMGAAPKELVGAVDLEPSRMRLRWLGKQLKAHGSHAAVTVMSKLLHSKGLQLRSGEDAVSDHAFNLASGALPPKVQSAIRYDEWDRLAAWYDANRECRAMVLEVDDEHMARAARLLRSINPEALPKMVWNPVDVLAEAVAISMGPLAPAGVGPGDLRSSDKSRVNPIKALVKIGVPHAVNRLSHSIRLLGPARVKRVLSGAFKLSTPLSGVVPVTHKVLLDYCLVAELGFMRRQMKAMDDDEFQRYVTSYCYAVECAIVASNYWRPQLNY
jgi:hypothetical protein